MKFINGALKDYAWGKPGISGIVGRFALIQQGYDPRANSLAVN